MSGFDRIKPPDRRLLERDEQREPDSSRADRQGRAALFSASGQATTPGAGARPRQRKQASPPPEAPSPPEGRSLPEGPSPLHVECGHCGVTAPLPLGDAVRKALPLVVIAPWKSHPIFATCPCGQRRAWLKPHVGMPR